MPDANDPQDEIERAAEKAWEMSDKKRQFLIAIRDLPEQLELLERRQSNTEEITKNFQEILELLQKQFGLLEQRQSGIEEELTNVLKVMTEVLEKIHELLNQNQT